MLICTGCGEVFPESACRRCVEPHGETVLVCPCCGDTPIEAARCACGSWHDPEDLFPGGWCQDCLTEQLTRDQVAEYLDSRDEWAAFLIDFLLDGQEALLRLLKRWFCCMAEASQADCLKQYMLASDAALFDFACWLRDRRESDDQ